MLTFLLTALLMHPIHETVSEVEWNSTSGRLEVALRMSVLDEEWIGRKIASDGKTEEWATAYLKSRFQLDPQPKAGNSKAGNSKAGNSSDKQNVKPTHVYHWIGRDEDGSHVWWYFEIEPANKQRPKVIDQRMLFERNEHYANRILFLGQVPRRAATLTIQQPSTTLDPRANDKSDTPKSSNESSKEKTDR